MSVRVQGEPVKCCISECQVCRCEERREEGRETGREREIERRDERYFRHVEMVYVRIEKEGARVKGCRGHVIAMGEDCPTWPEYISLGQYMRRIHKH